MDTHGQPISEERQAELRGYLDRWAAEADTDHGERKGPFNGWPSDTSVKLTGADVCWLANWSGRDKIGAVSNLRLGGQPRRCAPGDPPCQYPTRSWHLHSKIESGS